MGSVGKLLGVLLICFVGTGFLRGWFSLSKPHHGRHGDTVNIDLKVDRDKMRSDLTKARTKVRGEIEELEGQAKTEKTENDRSSN